MTPIWRYLTQSAGMTAQKLADAAGISVQQARADLARLEADGKACRERAVVGKPHLWWRVGSRPLNDLDVLLHMALGAHNNPSPERLREILASSANRCIDKATQKIVLLCAQSKAPHQIVWKALSNYEVEVAA